MTSCNAHPRMPPTTEVKTIARGEAILALLHSSERWNGASYPDIVQMTLTNDMRIAMPSDQSVQLVIVPQTVALSVNLGLLVVGEGIRMITTRRTRMFKIVPTELNRAIHNVGIEEMKLSIT